MAKEKNKPVPVRFDLKLLETLKEEEKIDTPQQALNFLTKFWENNRPAKDDVVGESSESKSASEPKPKKSTTAASKATPEEPKAKAAAAHPSGLSGIDLSIWKAEQKEKEKNG